MRTIIFMMLLVVVSKSAMAEWVMLGIIKDKSGTIYVDPDTIHKKDSKVKMWSLTDYWGTQKIDGLSPYLSTKTQEEYDCKGQQARTISFSLHSENMGGGKATNSLIPKSPEWIAIPPNSLVNARWKFACGAKSEKTAPQLDQEQVKKALYAKAVGLIEINRSILGAIYWSPLTKRNVGNLVRMSVVLDFNTSQLDNGKTYMSEIITTEYNCETKQNRNFSLETYSEEMGKGEVIHSYTEIGKWKPVVSVPGVQTEGEFEWKIACGKL
jgi:hypothetical protein